MKAALFAAMFVAALVAQPAFAHDDHKKRHSASAHDSAMAEGEVRKIDKEAKKITLKHGPITNLDMPGMTMVFQVADPAMLDKFKAGDKVKFSADKAGSGYAVTKIVHAH
jgi:Cu/Ag efflux protein CusF